MGMGLPDNKLERISSFGWVLPLSYFLLQNPDFASLLRGIGIIIFGYIIAQEDLKNKIVKNEILKKMLLYWAGMMSVMVLYNPEEGTKLLLQSIVGFLVSGAIFLAVYLMSGKGLGGGDVKFMAVAGLYIGYAYVIPAMLLGTTFAALVGGILILTKKIDRKSTMPLVPFLYVGILCAIL